MLKISSPASLALRLPVSLLLSPLFMILMDVGTKVKVHSFPIMAAVSLLFPGFPSLDYEKRGNSQDEMEPTDQRERISDGELVMVLEEVPSHEEKPKP